MSNVIELGTYCKDNGVVNDARTGLSDLLRLTAGKTLLKDTTSARLSKWSRKTLTEA